MRLGAKNWTFVQLLSAFLVCASCEQAKAPQEKLDWSSLPAHVTPSSQQRDIRVQDVALGRALFFEKKLSRDGKISCASCHLRSKYFQDGEVTSTGVFGDRLVRNSPSLLNIGWARYITWSNIAFFELERHMVVPLFGDTPPEMLANFDDDWLAQALADSPGVQAAIADHPDLEGALSWPVAIEMIAKYMRSLTSLDAPWDRQQQGEPVMSAQALAGQALFFSDRLGCASCHAPPFFSKAYLSGDAPRPAVRDVMVNTGLYFLSETESGYPIPDPGLMEFSGDPIDGGRFRIPSLRNVEFTAPYMHDGSIASLDEVIDHYAAGGRSIADGPNKGVGRDHPNRDPRLRGFELSAQERQELIAFLKSLSGSSLGQDGLGEVL